jgi:uncharacterized YigZ family protein
LAYAWPVADEEQVREHVDGLRKKYHDATHVCYAWRLGERERANDDGEPSGSAGRPILGQIISRGLTGVLVVVVRWFGGTKLGVPGLIAAYREAAADALDAASVVEKTVDVRLRVRFGWAAMNDVMRAVKEFSPAVVSQEFDNECVMELSIRESLAGPLAAKLEKTEGVDVEVQ